MPDTFTPNYNLTKPEVGASRDAWGTKWNGNADALDAALKSIMDDYTAKIAALQLVPPGTVAHFARPDTPAGWLRCNGAVYSRVTYAALFAAIGGYYGAPDGNTFQVPDYRGVFLRGLDEGRGLDPGRGFGNGYQDCDIQSHTHGLTGGGYVFQLYGSGPNITLATGNPAEYPGVHAVNIAATGGGETRPRNYATPICIKI